MTFKSIDKGRYNKNCRFACRWHCRWS